MNHLPKTKYLLMAVFLISCSLLLLKFTKSAFSDTEKIAGNSIQIGVWGEGVPTPTSTSTPTPTTLPGQPTPTLGEPTPVENTPTPTEEPISTPIPTNTSTPTPTNTPGPTTPVAGDVVINELMWMGSTVSDSDEWLELRNTTGNSIDLSNWQVTSLVGTGSAETLMLTIPSGKTISADGYFLISNFTKGNSAINVEPDLVDTDVVLRNSDLQIKLYKGIWTDSANLIDTADDGSGTPMAGTNGTNNQSMERKNDPSTGWHTCTDAACNDTTYWDTEGINYGTPKAPNL